MFFSKILSILPPKNSMHPAAKKYCVNVSSAGAMLVVLNRAPKGKLSIVLKAPVEAVPMLCLRDLKRMHFQPGVLPLKRPVVLHTCEGFH